MKKTFWIMMMAAALLLCGCAQEENPDMVDFSTAPTVAIEEVAEFPLLELEGDGSDAVFQGKHLATDDGMFLLKQVGTTFGQILHFFDYAMGETYPACALPNCSHDSESCGAYFYDGVLIHFDGEWLYYSVQEKGNAVLMRQRPDGSGREMIFNTNESGKSNVIGQIGGMVYADGKIYYALWGTLFDPETGKMESGEKICSVDLSTGKMEAFPYEFGNHSNSRTTYIKGICGDNLVVEHRSTEKTIGLEKYITTYFLLNVHTGEIQVLVQSWNDSKGNDNFGAIQISVADGLMIRQVNDSDEVLIPPVEGTADKTAVMYTGQRLVFDLEHQKGYLVTSEADLCTTETILDGYLQHYTWNDDRTAVIPMFRDLATGEELPMPEIFDGGNWYSPSRHGDYYVFDWEIEEGVWSTVGITRENFWSGNAEFHSFPEWAYIY